MSSYEYTVIPAPFRGEKTKGAKTGIDRFAATLSDTLNEMARDGWEYVRAETLPAEERSGLTSRNTVYHNLLVFRRALLSEAAAAPRVEARPVPTPATPRTETEFATPPVETATEPAVRAPFSQPMRSTITPAPKPVPAAPRPAEPPITRSPAHPLTPQGPRLGPASR